MSYILGVAGMGPSTAIVRSERLFTLPESCGLRLNQQAGHIYYNKILGLRRALQKSDNAEHRHSVVSEVKAVHDEVFSLLVDERVSANESLTIFLDLSNQVLNEAQDKR